MTAKHQWKKYKVDYKKIWEAKFHPKESDMDLDELSTRFNKEEDAGIYIRYELDANGRFTLTHKTSPLIATYQKIYAVPSDEKGKYVTDPIYPNNLERIYEFTVHEDGYSNFQYGGGYGRYYWFYSSSTLEGYYTSELKSQIPKQGAYIGLVQGQEGAFPQNGEKDGYWYVYDKKLNTPPTKPANLKAPDKVISKLEAEISWSESTDPEGDAISYKLERALDRGAFVEVYKGALTKFKDVIADKGHRLVVYKVTAIDSNGDASESLTSTEIPVIDNEIPVIETASANLGKITNPYSVSYQIKDADSGQTWKVTESLDGKVLKTFDAKVGTSYNSKLSASDWQKVLNGKHVLKIEVVDSEQGKDVKEISFEKDVRKLDFECAKAGLKGIDKMPERAILSMGATIPSGASIKVEITNNGLDAKPTWQDCTAQVLGGDKIFFSNKSKTATKWAVNIRVTADKKTATEVLSVSSIGGFYD